MLLRSEWRRLSLLLLALLICSTCLTTDAKRKHRTTTPSDAGDDAAPEEEATDAPPEEEATDAPADEPADEGAPGETPEGGGGEDEATEPPPTPAPKTSKPKAKAKATPITSPPAAGSKTASPEGQGDEKIDPDWLVDISIDPFPTSKKWQLFVVRAGQILEAMRNITLSLANTLNDKNPDFAANKTGLLANIEASFGAIWNPLDEFFEPLNDQLYESAPFLEINPAVGLTDLKELLEFAKTKPPGKRDNTRLKWVEIMSYAVQVHHTFDRLKRCFTQDGFAEIEDAVTIEYPSFKIVNVQNDSFAQNLYELQSPDVMVNYIHTEFDAMGPENQLIRGLERILRKDIQEWDPRKTDTNKYCYGTNKFATIHDGFDLMTDAALYLIMADMKYAIFQTTATLYAAYKEAKGKEEPIDIVPKFEDIMKNLTERIDKKIKLGGAPPNETIAEGPLLMNCDIPDPPKDPACVQDPEDQTVTIKDNKVYIGEKEAKIDEATKYALYENGTRIPGVEPVKRYVKADDKSPIANSEVLYSVNEEGKVVDKNDTVQADIEVTIVYKLYAQLQTEQTDSSKPFIEASPQWGKFNCTAPSAGMDPQCGPPGLCPYTDPRPPSDNTTKGSYSFHNAYSGYLEAEPVLNPKGSCVGTCPDYKKRVSTCENTDHCDIYRQSVCEPGKNCLEKSKCPHKARKCERTAQEVSFCPSKSEDRLYDWININGQIRSVMNGTDSNETVTENPACDGEVFKTIERWDMEFGVILTQPQYCEVCLCVCDDPMVPSGNHYVDLTEGVSNVAEGYVVTAVRFEQENNTLRLNIEEGKLQADGDIDSSTLRWLPREPVNIADPEKAIKLGSKGFRDMNLDLVRAHVDQVVTGLKFVKFGEHSLSIEAQLTKLDKATGLLPTGGAESTWQAPHDPEPVTPRKVIKLDDVSSPMRQHGPSQPFDVPDNTKCVEFDATSLKTDAGQAVVPFFDFQPSHATTVARKAIQGVGIIYKSKIGSGGYLAPVTQLYEKPYAL